MTRVLTFKLTTLQFAKLLVIGILGIIILTLTLQHIGGYPPCELCLKERNPYYYCLPIAILATISARNDQLPWLTFFLLITITFIMLSDSILGIFHSGIEWKLWSGSKTCAIEKTSSNNITNTTDLLASINNVKKASCSQVELYILGLSLAVWNVIISLTFATISFIAARKIFKDKILF